MIRKMSLFALVLIAIPLPEIVIVAIVVAILEAERRLWGSDHSRSRLGPATSDRDSLRRRTSSCERA